MRLTFLYPAERVVLVFTLFAFALLAIFDLPSVHFLRLYLNQFEVSLQCYVLGLLFACIWFIVIIGHRIKSGRLPAEHPSGWTVFKDYYLNVGTIIRDFRMINAIQLMYVTFNYLKHLTPHVNPIIYDLQLLEFEKAILAGYLPSDLMLMLFGEGSMEFFSKGYTSFYFFNAILCFVMLFQRKVNKYHEFFTAFTLVWFLSILIIYIYPTWGPCFFIPESYTWFAGTHISDLQANLWTMKLELDANPQSKSAMFLISGLPSLHVAAVILGSIYFWKVSKMVGIVSWAFTFLTVLTTIYFGWHYVMDDVASVVMVYAAIYFAKNYKFKEVEYKLIL